MIHYNLALLKNVLGYVTQKNILYDKNLMVNTATSDLEWYHVKQNLTDLSLHWFVD